MNSLKIFDFFQVSPSKVGLKFRGKFFEEAKLNFGDSLDENKKCLCFVFLIVQTKVCFNVFFKFFLMKISKIWRFQF